MANGRSPSRSSAAVDHHILPMSHDSYSDETIQRILKSVRTIAMVGASNNNARPSYFVLKYLMSRGYRLFPINPGLAGKGILGAPVYAKLADIPEPLDMVEIFRNSAAASGIVDEALELAPPPKVIWMQLGVRNDDAAARAEAKGIEVIMNRCPKIEYGRLSGEIGWTGVNSRILSARKPQMLRGFQKFTIDRRSPCPVPAPTVRFYAGAVLRTPEGLPLGTVCVLDHKPRPQGLKEGQAFTLRVLARQVMMQMQLRRALAERESALREQEDALEAIRESEERFRVIANSAPVPIWVTSASGPREFTNFAYQEFLGVSYDEALTFDWRRAIHPDHLPRILKEQVAGESSGKTFTLECVYKRADGEWRWLRSISQPRLGSHGERNGFIGIAHDITTSKQAEQDLQQMNQ